MNIIGIEKVQNFKKSQKKTICFITGGSGFVGKNLILELLKLNNIEIHCLLYDKCIDRHGLIEFAEKKENRGIIFIHKGDLLNKKTLMDGMPENTDVVFHVAGYISLWKKENGIQDKVNIQGTKNMIEVSLVKNVKRFVYTSSCCVYGFQESMVDENAELKADSEESKFFNYGLSKLYAEKEVRKGMEKGLNVLIFRPHGMMGENGTRNCVNYSLILKIIDEKGINLVTGGYQEYPDVIEVAKAQIRGAFDDNIKSGEVFNLGGEHVKYCDMVKCVCSELGYKIPYFLTPSMMYLFAFFEENFMSCCFKRKPLLTYEATCFMLNPQKLNSNKAIKQLGYKIVSGKTLHKRAVKYILKNLY